MVTISPMQPDQIAAAKLVIAAVAGRIFSPEMTSLQFAEILEEEQELQDVDEYLQVYGRGRGIFLVVQDGGRLVGTGALKPLEGQTAELKRLWLLEDYHGQGLGYRLVQSLFEFARKTGYQRVVLQTHVKSERAIGFYRRVGFVEIPPFYEKPEEDDRYFGIDLQE